MMTKNLQSQFDSESILQIQSQFSKFDERNMYWLEKIDRSVLFYSMVYFKFN